MITIENLNNLVGKLAEIEKLGLQYNLDDIVLGKHSYRPKERLYFVLSRKGKVLTLREGADVHVALCDLLGAERYKEEDDVAVEIKEIFNPGCFEEAYSERISLIGHVDTAKEKKQKVVAFIKDQLDFNEYVPTISSSPERKRRSTSEVSGSQTLPSSVHDDTDVESPLKKQRTEEEKSNLVSSASLSDPLSGAFFASSGRQESAHMMNALSHEQQQAVRQAVQQAEQILEREIKKNPGCRDVMLAKFGEEFERTQLMQHDQVRVSKQVAAI